MKETREPEARISAEHPWLPRVDRGEPFEIKIDGQPVVAYPGETIATALLASGRRIFHHPEEGSPRGAYCGMGVCFSCLVTVDGLSSVRACVTPARPGMQVQTGQEKGGQR